MSQPRRVKLPSIDDQPWAHPFLTESNIGRFRSYSERIWQQARSDAGSSSRFSAGFAVNMAQSMYKWATLAAGQGVDATVYLNPHDRTAISRPEWEEFAGSYPDVLDGDGFLASHRDMALRVPVVEPPIGGDEFMAAYRAQREVTPERTVLRDFWSRLAPAFAAGLLDAPGLRNIRKRSPSLRHRPMLELDGLFPYFQWAELLARHDVNYIASNPIAAYLSGKPYCIFSVGGDLQFDAGRADDYGQAMRDAFAHATFICVSNPHTLGHCRRLGLVNAVYLPYPMDSDRYCPGPGVARADWTARFGGEVFVLTTARIDSAVKGHTPLLVEQLLRVARQRPGVRFIFLGWGVSTNVVVAAAAEAGLADQFIVLPPAGKQQLIDYYRSADIVLDQFVYGYYGATALEAAAVGKPIVMRLREEHYAPLYRGDVAPVLDADSPESAAEHLVALIDDPSRREQIGRAGREWLVRTHGEALTAPLMVSLLHHARRGRPQAIDDDNPLCDPLTDAERDYHDRCRALAMTA